MVHLLSLYLLKLINFVSETINHPLVSVEYGILEDSHVNRDIGYQSGILQCKGK